MFRPTSVSVALAAALGSAAAAPVPKDPPKPPPLYFPTTVGTRWVYEVDGEERTEVVTAVEHKAKERVWIVSVGRVDKDGTVTAAEAWEVSHQGLVLVKGRGDRESRPFQFLKLPHRANEKWALHPDAQLDFRCVALGPRRVKVPAGEFEAVGVEVYAGDALLTTRWYAPGVGLVRVGDDKETRRALKSFTPGKN